MIRCSLIIVVALEQVACHAESAHATRHDDLLLPRLFGILLGTKVGGIWVWFILKGVNYHRARLIESQPVTVHPVI